MEVGVIEELTTANRESANRLKVEKGARRLLAQSREVLGRGLDSCPQLAGLHDV